MHILCSFQSLLISSNLIAVVYKGVYIVRKYVHIIEVKGYHRTAITRERYKATAHTSTQQQTPTKIKTFAMHPHNSDSTSPPPQQKTRNLSIPYSRRYTITLFRPTHNTQYQPAKAKFDF